jgi:glycogen(starch) synthase
MRILMTADTVGGVWTYTVDLARALTETGADVQVATMGRLPDQSQRRALAQIYASSYRLEWEDEPWEDVDRAGAWLLELAETLQPDLVHLNGYVHASLPWPVPVVVAAHSDVVSWWRAVRRSPPPAIYERYISAVTAGLRAASAIVAPTQAVIDDLRRSYRYRTPEYVVPNGRATTPPLLRKERVVVGLGRFWDEAKNVRALEQARGLSRWPVIVAGPGTARGRLSPTAVAELLASAAIFVSPARYEPFGLSILEAAAAGCALVLGDIPSLREVWGDAAIFAAPDDEAALAAALRLLQDDDELREELGHRARRRATRYTVDRMRDGYLAVYDALRSEVAA